MYTNIILMKSCFVPSLQIDSIFVTFDFTAFQRGVNFLLPTTVYIIFAFALIIDHFPCRIVTNPTQKNANILLLEITSFPVFQILEKSLTDDLITRHLMTCFSFNFFYSSEGETDSSGVTLHMTTSRYI